MSIILSVDEKIRRVQQEVKNLVKNVRNEAQGYFYFTESSAIDILKPLFEKYGLAFFCWDCRETKIDTRITEEEINGKKKISFTLVYLKFFEIADTTGSYLEKKTSRIFPWWTGATHENWAKAKGSADTYAEKNFFAKNFLIKTINDDDPDRT